MSVRLSYTDANGDGVIQPAAEIIEENNYYPFGLQHRGYNELPGTYGNAAAQKYKYNGKEWQEEFNLNVTAMDFRQYDNALGRFYSPDALSELAYDQTPYRFGFNNPTFWSDPSGLFESWGAANDHKMRYGLGNAQISYNADRGVYEIANEGYKFYKDGENIISYFYEIDGEGGGFTMNFQTIKGGAYNSSSGYNHIYGNFSNNGNLSGLSVAGFGAALNFEQNFMYNQKTWRSLEYGRSYSQRFHGNQYVTDKAVAKNISRGFNVAGKALGAYNSYSINQQYTEGQINDFQMISEQGMNAFSTFGGTVGAAAGIGWELGRAVTTIPAYQRFKHETWLPWRQRNWGY